ncbi:MAG: hypothetical protein LBK67_10745 [Coriobacteriales bacterium]|jgi:hypothetical protein|nr:hypothetical protein [Coriobacteriales bacterium]
MEQDPQKALEVIFEVADLSYDPLDDFEVDDEDLDASEGQQRPQANYQAKLRNASASDNRPASQRIKDLFIALAPRRRVLLNILKFLEVPEHSDVLQQKVEELQKYDVSVYSSYHFSLLLNEAGAICKVNEDGSIFDEEAEQLPAIIEVDGLKFFKPTDGKQVFWLITDDGRAYLEADNPHDRLTRLIAEEQRYQTIYKRVLEFCDNEAGRSVDELAALVDNDPLVQTPRKYFSYFVKKLEDCGALLWAKTWHTTEEGRQGLEVLFSGNGEAETKEKQGSIRGGEQS